MKQIARPGFITPLIERRRTPWVRCGLASRSSKLFGMVISRSTSAGDWRFAAFLRRPRRRDLRPARTDGAGKSTLIRILMDIIRPDSGEVRVFGEPRRRAHLDRLGYLPEERGLYTKLTVTDVMTYFGALKGLSRAEARRRSSEWLERVELPHVAGWKIDRLSKGMSQKVQIASVLLADPELCVLDEPTTGLDPVNVGLVQDLLLERRRSRRTTILSTHQMNQVEALCDRVAMINRGRLMVYGEVDEVRRDHSLPEVRVHARGPCQQSPQSRARSMMGRGRGG